MTVAYQEKGLPRFDKSTWRFKRPVTEAILSPGASVPLSVLTTGRGEVFLDEVTSTKGVKVIGTDAVELFRALNGREFPPSSFLGHAINQANLTSDYVLGGKVIWRATTEEDLQQPPIDASHPFVQQGKVILPRTENPNKLR